MKTLFIAVSLAMPQYAMEMFGHGFDLECIRECLRCNFERRRNGCDDVCDCCLIDSIIELEPEFPDECPESQFPEPTSYTFTDGDDPLCQSLFNFRETLYNSRYDDYVTAEEDWC